ncbi:ABC transporter substrate-binding protein [Pantoea phytobeneficialis]|uniref:ABC transporter substrate-binding protein n=1 Tax=Pantoea phytobeneficialis TaxID=2052056 RepID=A0AAP9H959_9GAMM|nr:ABC transporter substrate-binding protein [Pantoea phytobeneficialis]MDO6408723.1 ABC transporter substrate-binding protein [Pantoea phytobeneficialis]QGR08973.1 thiamine biosynthesis protein [Pantoea phytobeneficialis]
MKNLGTVITALLLLVTSSVAQANEKVRLLLDWFVNPNHAAIFAAQYSGAFKKEGLDVEMIAPADSASVPLLLAAGKADLAISYQPQLYTLVDKDVPVIRVGTLINQPLNTLTTVSADIHSLKDFAGKSLGYAIPGFEDVAIRNMLKSQGVDPDSVRLINLNMDAVSALLTHKIDGAMTVYRNYELLELQDKGAKPVVFKPEDFGVPAYDELIILANQKTAAQDKRIPAFLRGLDAGVAWLRAHPEQAWQAFIKQYPELNTPLNRQGWQATLPYFASHSATLDTQRYQAFAQYMKANGLIQQVAPMTRYALQ